MQAARTPRTGGLSDVTALVAAVTAAAKSRRARKHDMFLRLKAADGILSKKEARAVLTIQDIDALFEYGAAGGADAQVEP
jgi:hypothetical protein